MRLGFMGLVFMGLGLRSLGSGLFGVEVEDESSGPAYGLEGELHPRLVSLPSGLGFRQHPKPKTLARPAWLFRSSPASSSDVSDCSVAVARWGFRSNLGP